MPTAEEIRDYLTTNPGLTDQQIASAMTQFNVSPLQMAQATNIPLADVQSRFDTANLASKDESIANRIAEIQSQGGTQYDIAREARNAGLSAQDLSRVTGMSPEDISRLSGGVLGGGIPPRPTFSGVAAEWNKTHQERFGQPLNAALVSKEDIQRQANELQSLTKSRQAEWDKLYGDTPEGKAVKENAPPDWRQIYEPWVQSHIKQFGNIVDRPWSTDPASISQKQALDEQYIKAIQDYNKKYGTNIAPDPSVLGSFSQPSEFYKEPEREKWYDNPLNVAAAVAALYFGVPYLAETIGGLETLGAAEVLPGAGAEVFALGEPAVPFIESIPGVAETITSSIPGVEIIDKSIPFDPKAYNAISTTQGLTDLAKAGFETITQNPLQSLRTANTLNDLYQAVTGGGGGDSSGVDKNAANMIAQGLAMLQPGQSQYALPGSLESTYLSPAPGANEQQQNFLAQLKQLDPELLKTLSSRALGAKEGGHIPEFITGATGHYVQGRGDGQSDDIPAMLADGEYVFDADTVAALGNGSNKAGAAVLDKMRQSIRKHKRSASVNNIPPKAKSPLEYLKG